MKTKPCLRVSFCGSHCSVCATRVSYFLSLAAGVEARLAGAVLDTPVKFRAQIANLRGSCKLSRNRKSIDFVVPFCFLSGMSVEFHFATIVSGLPRSGTSLMMQMLSAGGMPILTDHKRVADEDNPKGYWEFEPVKNTKASAQWLHEAQGKAVKMVHLLLLDLPSEGHAYRVLLMKRRITEVLNSQRAMLLRRGKSGAAVSAEQLAQTFLRQMERVEKWLREQPHLAYLPVDYNELVANPAPQAGAINHFLGGVLDTQKMIEVVDPLLHRQRML
jgi:hypothetical protein